MVRRREPCVVEKRVGARWCWHGRANGRRVKALREAFEDARIRG